MVMDDHAALRYSIARDGIEEMPLAGAVAS